MNTLHSTIIGLNASMYTYFVLYIVIFRIFYCESSPRAQENVPSALNPLFNPHLDVHLRHRKLLFTHIMYVCI